jgi:Xaa-Pro aminopeptidase
MDYRRRQQALRAQLEHDRLGGMLITHLPNIRYLCGFTGSAGLLAVISDNRRLKAAFFTDGRYTEQAAAEVNGAKVVISKQGALKDAVKWLAAHGGVGAAKIAFEADHVSAAAYDSLRKSADGIRWQATRQVVERLRMIKEPAELDQIRAAIHLASQVYDAVVADIAPGVTESSIAAELEYMCRRLGAEGMSFDTIVAAGKRSALPHGKASNLPIPPSGFVILDFGVILGGYCSDMTRTVHVGRPNQASRRMYQAVLEAQLAGIKAVKAGVETAKVDHAARKVLEKAGLGEYFTHSTGHGVGLEIHEGPGLRRTAPKAPKVDSGKPERLEPGMVVTIEPGVYVPGKGGVRIEDMVLVTATGCDVLTPTGKELIVL